MDKAKVSMKVPVCEASIGEEELRNVTDCVKSGWISGYKGKYIDQFEQEFARYCGAKHGITTTSCATALLLSLETLGVGAGDEVITTDFTMLATVAAIVRARAKPVLVDVERDTWCVDPELIERAVTARTRAIMPVPIYGHPVDVEAIRGIADRYGLLVIEDAAEAIGSEYADGKRVGSAFDAACFSFYINKMISTGEGGMVLTSDDDLAVQLHRMKGYDTDPENRFIHKRLGFNYRMTNLAASVGCAQIQKIDGFLAKKRHIAKFYENRLGKLDVTLPAERIGCRNSYWVYAIVLPTGYDRDQIIGKLAEMGVETRRFFHPMHLQPALRKYVDNWGVTWDGSFPVSVDIGRHGLYLPNGVTLTDEQLDYTCKRLEKVLG